MRKTEETVYPGVSALLTPKQVAAHAAFKSSVTVLRAFRRGDLPGHKLNARTIRFSPRDVAQWLDSARVKGSTPK
jgi:hypothetical protein